MRAAQVEPPKTARAMANELTLVQSLQHVVRICHQSDRELGGGPQETNYSIWRPAVVDREAGGYATNTVMARSPVDGGPTFRNDLNQ